GIEAGKTVTAIATLVGYDVAKVGTWVVFGKTSDGCDTLKAHAAFAKAAIKMADKMDKTPLRYRAFHSVQVKNNDRRFRFDTCIWEEWLALYDTRVSVFDTRALVGQAYFKVTLPFGCKGAGTNGKVNDPGDDSTDTGDDPSTDPSGGDTN